MPIRIVRYVDREDPSGNVTLVLGEGKASEAEQFIIDLVDIWDYTPEELMALIARLTLLIDEFPGEGSLKSWHQNFNEMLEDKDHWKGQRERIERQRLQEEAYARSVTVTYGLFQSYSEDYTGKTVQELHDEWVSAWGMPDDQSRTVPILLTDGNKKVDWDYITTAGDHIQFFRRSAGKGGQ